MEQLYALARAMESFVFPIAVGPPKTIRYLEKLEISVALAAKIDYV